MGFDVRQSLDSRLFGVRANRSRPCQVCAYASGCSLRLSAMAMLSVFLDPVVEPALLEPPLQAIDGVSVVSGDVVGEAELFSAPSIPPFGEWLDRALGVFSATLDFIMDTSLLRFFAVFGFVWVCFSLASYLVRSGKALSR